MGWCVQSFSPGGGEEVALGRKHAYFTGQGSRYLQGRAALHVARDKLREHVLGKKQEEEKKEEEEEEESDDDGDVEGEELVYQPSDGNFL